jgi:hypothetical protein
VSKRANHRQNQNQHQHHPTKQKQVRRTTKNAIASKKCAAIGIAPATGPLSFPDTRLGLQPHAPSIHPRVLLMATAPINAAANSAATPDPQCRCVRCAETLAGLSPEPALMKACLSDLMGVHNKNESRVRSG